MCASHAEPSALYPRSEPANMSAAKVTPYRHRAYALTKAKRKGLQKVDEESRRSGITEDTRNSERTAGTNSNDHQPVAADGYLIRPWRESMGYDPDSDELYFRARKSSSSSIGSNRRSCEIKVAEDNLAGGADQVDDDLNEDAPPANQDLMVS